MGIDQREVNENKLFDFCRFCGAISARDFCAGDRKGILSTEEECCLVGTD